MWDNAIRALIDKKTIRAPFSGQLGIRLVGTSANRSPPAKASSRCRRSRPVFADFSLPQQDLEKLATGLGVQVTSDTFPGKI